MWPENLFDCKRAATYLRLRAGELHFDESAIGAIGGSAGAHLVAMLATTSKAARLNPIDSLDYSIAAGVCLYGVGNISRWLTQTTVPRLGMEAAKLMLGPTATTSARYDEASPELHASSESAPLLLVHGTGDEIVSYRESEHFHAELQSRGARSDLIIVDKAPHSFDLHPPVCDLLGPVLTFFKRWMQKF